MNGSQKPTLLILAAGIGSRYGSLKQIDQIGPSGETIIDYSVFDAVRAGFGKVVFVIRKDIEKDFKEVFDNRFGDKIKVDYVFQELDNLPDGLKLPSERQKPWGTAHAVLMAKDTIKEPFAVINADDFYGADSFVQMAKFFSNETYNENEYCMIGYQLKKTLSEHGYVSRGICESGEDHFLKTVVERTKIGFEGKIIGYHEKEEFTPLTGDEVVSMNFWGFKTSFFNFTNEYFIKFLHDNLNKLKSEFYIPYVVNNLITEEIIKLKVLNTDSDWFGVTYKEDKPSVIKKVEKLIKKGIYPKRLWE